ncbi:MAG: GNAT family N-acetyltransferase [Gemmatimonadales bacterium]|nr:GNAT family N-acetyltransferase [Gemmatimonadales bacterium]
MAMWQPDRAVTGPERATHADVDALNRVFSEAFTDRYRKDGLGGVRVPHLNPAIWRYAIADAGDGAMVWRDARGEVVAFNMVHLAGTEGWMGPLAVRTDRQGGGLGREIVEAGVKWLQQHGARTIGLETMPRTIDNIGFYSRLGFLPGHLTVSLQRDRPRALAIDASRVGALDQPGRAAVIGECGHLSRELGAGVDFTAELDLTLGLGLGDVTVLRDTDGRAIGFGLWHTVPLVQGRPREELRLLKLVARDFDAAIKVVGALERETAAQALRHLTVRCQTAHHELYAALIADGYRVQWTDLRLTLAGTGVDQSKGVVLSNWEI